MSRQLSFSFEELPLVIDLGFEAGLVNGSALIDYWPDGQWGISQVYLDGARQKPLALIISARLRDTRNFKRFDERDVLLDRASPLNLMIQDRLENEWRPKVQEAVREALEEERVVEHA